jgi:hypothetical protein
MRKRAHRFLDFDRVATPVTDEQEVYTGPKNDQGETQKERPDFEVGIGLEDTPGNPSKSVVIPPRSVPR